MKFSLTAIATIVALSSCTAAEDANADPAETDPAADMVNELIQTEEKLLAEEIELRNELAGGDGVVETSNVIIDFNDGDAEEYSNMTMMMMTTTSEELRDHINNDTEHGGVPILYSDPVVVVWEPEHPMEPEYEHEHMPEHPDHEHPEPEQHHESNHQHKKSERLRAKAGKSQYKTTTTPTTPTTTTTADELLTWAKTYKEESELNFDAIMGVAPPPHKKTHSKSSKSGTTHHSVSMSYDAPPHKKTTSKASKAEIHQSMSSHPSAIHSKSAKAKGDKRGKVAQELSHPMDTTTKKKGGKTHKVMSMHDSEAVPHLAGGKSHKNNIMETHSETMATVAASPPKDETTTPPGYIEYTEAPEDEPTDTAAVPGMIPAPDEEMPDGDAALADPEEEEGTETQPVVRTPDIIPMGTDTSDLKSNKYTQEVKEAMLGGKNSEKHNVAAATTTTHTKKENVAALDLGDGESRLKNGSEMADVTSSASSVLGGVVVGTSGFCLMMSVVYAMVA